MEYGRLDEADTAAAEAAAIAQGVEHVAEAAEDPARRAVGRGTQSVTWTPLSPIAAYAATTAGVAASADLATLQAERQRQAAAWIQQSESTRIGWSWSSWSKRDSRRSSARPSGCRPNAPPRLSWLPNAHGREEAERLEAKRRAAAEEAERFERKRRREERIEAHRLEVERREAERREAEGKGRTRAAGEEQLAADPAEAERLELERLQAEIDELERAEKRVQAENAVEHGGKSRQRSPAT